MIPGPPGSDNIRGGQAPLIPFAGIPETAFQPIAGQTTKTA